MALRIFTSFCALGWILLATIARAEQVPSPSLTDFPELPKSRPQAIVSGPDGAIWYGTATRICRIAMDGKRTEIKLPDNLTTTIHGTVVQSLVFAPDGNLWGAYNQGNCLWRMTPAGEFTEFKIPTVKAWPRDTAVGPDGNIWFTELEGNKIARITNKGEFTEYAIPTAGAHPYGLCAGPDGQMWFTEYYKQKIGRVSMTGEFAEFPTPKHGEDAPGGPRCIAKGNDGNLWFTEWKANKIGRITPKGEITEFDIPTARSGSIGICAGPDGNVWYCGAKGKRIGRVSPKGEITEYPLHADSEPYDLTAGPDGNIWLTDESDRVGKITITGGEKPAAKK